MASREQEVMDLAIDLYARSLQDEEKEARDRALAVAAQEVGVPKEFVERAAAMLEANRASALAKKQKNRKIAAAAIGISAMVGTTAFVMYQPPPAAVIESFASADARWTLDRSPGSTASVRYTADAAVITVERFVADGAGKYHVNLDRRLDVAPVDRHKSVTVRLRGKGLEAARVYLEGDGARWRSPPLPITAEWKEHTIPLATFDHQERAASGFRTVGHGDLKDIRVWSVKLGEFMNPVTATGEIEIDELRFD